jgi:hypothetical protein
MGRHTVGNKRGSVRGAPPDVYVGFLNGPEDREPWADALRLSKHFLILATVWFVLWIIWQCLVSIGILPDIDD